MRGHSVNNRSSKPLKILRGEDVAQKETGALPAVVDYECPSGNALETMHITEINRYPLKSGAADILNEGLLKSTGLTFDRHWMVVSEEKCGERLVPLF